MIYFESITVEGFGSFVEPETFDLSKNGLFLVKGQNGHGKTTLFSALLWGLYGITLKGSGANVQTWEHLRPKNFAGTRVLLTFRKANKRYTVARHVGFKGKTFGNASSPLMVFEHVEDSGMQAITDQHKDGKQEFLENLLELSQTAFLNTVLFGQRMQRIVSASNADKRELFEELFELNFIERAKNNAKDFDDEITNEYNEVSNDTLRLASEISVVRSKYETSVSLKESFEANKAKKLAEIDNKLNSEKGKLSSLQAANKELETQIKACKILEYAELEEQLEKVREKLNEVQEDAYALQVQQRKFREEFNTATGNIQALEKKKVRAKHALDTLETSCKVCGKLLDPESVEPAREKLTQDLTRTTLELNQAKDYVKALTDKGLELAYEDKLGRLEQVKESLKTQIQAIQSDMQGFQAQKNKAQKLAGEFQSNTYAIRSSFTLIEDYEQQRARVVSEACTISDEDISSLKNEWEAMKEQAEAQQAKLEAILAKREKVSFWVKKAFGASGLRSYIFAAMLEKLNAYINQYADVLGVAVRFSVDLSRASKPFTTECMREGAVIPYIDLSGGEKQRIDVATAFALHDLVAASKAKFNILILDEALEGLDEKGADLVFQLLRMKRNEGKGVYVITHNALVDCVDAQNIVVEKDHRGYSQITT